MSETQTGTFASTPCGCGYPDVNLTHKCGLVAAPPVQEGMPAAFPEYACEGCGSQCGLHAENCTRERAPLQAGEAVPTSNRDVLRAVSILDDLRASLGSTELETAAYLKLVDHVKDMAARMNRLAGESIVGAAQKQFAVSGSAPAVDTSPRDLVTDFLNAIHRRVFWKQDQPQGRSWRQVQKEQNEAERALRDALEQSLSTIREQAVEIERLNKIIDGPRVV